MKLANKNRNRKLLTPAQMKDGDIGVIRKWSYTLAYIGDIVQKFENDKLITLGKNWKHSFKNADKITSDDCLIEILPPGTLLEI